MSADEERSLEKAFERCPPPDDAEMAKSTYAYARRATTSAVGGVDLLLSASPYGGPTLSMVRCGYATDEVVKEGSERKTVALLSRDLQYAFGAKPVANSKPPAFVIDKCGRRTELDPETAGGD